MHDETNDIGLLRPVAAGELRTIWPHIAAHVARVAGDCEEPWLAEDVFLECVNGNAHLFVLDDLSGFCVFRLFATNYERQLFVWVTWNASASRVVDYVPQLLDLARANDCNRIAWESPRKFHRALPMARVRYNYSIEVESEA